MGNIIFVILLWIFFSYIGLAIAYDMLEYGNIYFKITVFYFVGIFFALTFIRLFTLVTDNFKLGIGLTFSVSGVLLLINLKKIKNFTIVNWNEILKVFIACILVMLGVCVLLSLCCVYGYPGQYDTYSALGSGHSGRYVNLAYDIVLNNRIPIVGQNYGQSMLVALGLQFGQMRPYFQLNLWVDITISSFILFTYGLLLHYGVAAKFSKIATLIIVFANTALSLNYIAIIDTGFPIIKSGYVDSHLEVATCVITLMYFGELVLRKGRKLNWLEYLALFILGIGWNITGAHIGCIISVALFLLLLANILWFKRKNIYLSIMALLVSFVLGTFTGGALTSSTLYEPLNFEGMIAAHDALRKLKILPYLHYELGLNGIAWADRSNICWYAKEMISGTDKFIWWYSVETAFFEAVRLVFWPLIGIVAYGINCWKTKKLTTRLSCETILFINASFLLLVGLGVAYGIEYGSKVWLTRFAASGYYMGFICLMIVLFGIYQRNTKMCWISIGAIFLLMVIGPATNILLAMKNQIVLLGGVEKCFKNIIEIYNFAPDIFY